MAQAELPISFKDYVEWISPFLITIWNESDRGCALVGAAYLDNDLEKILRVSFSVLSEITEPELNSLLGTRPDGKADNPFAPLKSFSARIQAAYAIGLLRVEVRNGLNIVREIRNYFAHKEGSLLIPADKVDQLWKACCSEGMGWAENAEKYLLNMKGHHSEMSEVRVRLTGAMGCLRCWIHGKTRQVARLTTGELRQNVFQKYKRQGEPAD